MQLQWCLKTHFAESWCRLEKWVVGATKRTYAMNDAQNPYEFEEDAMRENFRVGNDETDSNGRIFQDTPPDFAATMRSLRVEMQIYREDNEIMIKDQEEKN